MHRRERPAGACRAIVSALRSFARRTEGTTAVEFAIIAIPFLSIIFFLLQMCLIFFWGQSVEHATIQSARAIRAGTVQTAGMSAQQYKDKFLCPLLTAGLSCDNAIVSVNRVPKTWASNHSGGIYNFVDMSGPSLTAPATQQASAPFCPGSPGDMIFIDVVYRAPIPVPWAWPSQSLVTIDGQYFLLLRATAVVVGEPYVTSVTSTC